ncbi:hypothetical protein ABZ611_08880 [Streptomyces sp. NPDC007861]|uniref:hypothetical protein n=1 Tax=Streptomyces sp. NPDC007861 TaxID=3154893 RepID=UPI0033C587DB
MGTFATSAKSASAYLDLAANSHGEEKALFVYHALQRTPADSPHVVEIGPGGGAAVRFLASRIDGERTGPGTVTVTLIEAPGITSTSLDGAIEEFNRVGVCALRYGLAQDLGRLLPEPVDVVSASALMHEVYSYGGGYGGLHRVMQTLPQVVKPGGFFVYRDVYAVADPSLHDQVTQTYSARSWLQFLRMFAPLYLSEGTHPYHHSNDDPVVRQNSCNVTLDAINPKTCAVITAPVGLFREIQRHYITFRDHAWRSGVLGFRPDLDGLLASDWIDAATGHKRVHYTLTGANWLSARQAAMLTTVSEPYADHYVVDGDIFDDCTDAALVEFLAAAEAGDGQCTAVWEEWSAREGRETYAYLTVDELIKEFAISSAEAGGTIMIPRLAQDVATAPRNYYNRYLRHRLANPLNDSKQLVLFSNIPVSDADALLEAMTTVRKMCSKKSMARMHSAIMQRT